jgi:hypothetical protein
VVTTHFRFATIIRLVLAVLLTANAIAPGVCAALCSAKACCPKVSHQLKASSGPDCGVAHCAHCQMPKASRTVIRGASSPPNCCAWIGNKVDPPAAFAKVFATSAVSHVAVLSSVAIADVALTMETDAPQFYADDRAPPGRPTSPSDSRAPPTR